MNRLLAPLLLALLALTPPAVAQSSRELLDVNITTAVTGLVGNTIPLGRDYMTGRYIIAQAKFTYTSGGTNATAYIQTSLDNGLTWCDVMSIQFTTSTARRVSAVSTNVALSAATTCTDGSLTANTIVNGLIGDLWRVKYTTTGTYGAGTNLTVTAVPR